MTSGPAGRSGGRRDPCALGAPPQANAIESAITDARRTLMAGHGARTVLLDQNETEAAPRLLAG
jgi:hypothetical protein